MTDFITKWFFSTESPERWSIPRKNHFLLKTAKIKMKPKKITPAQAQEIIDIACAEWQEKLAEEWGKTMVLGHDIEVSQDFIAEMRSAATDSQKAVLDEIFGPTHMLEPGEICKIGLSGTLCQVISNLEYGHVSVAFRDGSHAAFPIENLRKTTTKEKESFFPNEGVPCLVMVNNYWHFKYARHGRKFSQKPQHAKSGLTKWRILPIRKGLLPEEE